MIARLGCALACGVLSWGSPLTAQVPPVPDQVAASKGTYPGAVRIWWTSVPDAAAYDIWRNTVPDKNTAQYFASVGGSRNEFIDTTTPPNASFYYWVRTVYMPGIPSDYGFYHEGYWTPGPNPPSNVQASNGGFPNFVRVTWNSVSGATGYRIWRNSVNEPHGSTPLATVTGTAFDDMDVDGSQTYYYWVTALSSDGISGFGSGDSGFATPAPPERVTGLQASVGTSLDDIRLTWNETTGAERYEVWRSDTPNLWDSEMIDNWVTDTEFVDDTVPPLTEFTYWVRAVNSIAWGTFSDGATGYRELKKPAKPLFLFASDGMFSGRIRLSWEGVDRAMEYEILRNVVRHLPSATVIDQVPAEPGFIEYWDEDAEAETVYFYWVRGINNAGAGEASWSTSGFWTRGPDAPQNIQATDGAVAGAVVVSWIAAPGAVGYEVWRSKVRDTDTATQIGTTTQTTFTDSSAAPETLYHYWIKAYNAQGASGFSWSDSGYVAGPTPVVRSLTVASAEAAVNEVIMLPIVLNAKGDEHAIGFTIQFDPNLLNLLELHPGDDFPPDAIVLENDSLAGHLGVALALPAGETMDEGAMEILQLELQTRPDAAGLPAVVALVDDPTARSVLGVDLESLPTEWIAGVLDVSASVFPGYEADVWPLPNGNGTVGLEDWVQVGRFVAGLDPMPTGSLFQRADCAPRSTLGDGTLSIADWVQAGRYAQGLDPLTEAGGPTEPAAAPLGMMPLPEQEVAHAADASISLGTVDIGDRVWAPLLLESDGQVNALSFTVTFDPEELSCEEVKPGPEVEAMGARLILNESQLDQGRLGVALAMPPGESLPAGIRKLAGLRWVPVHTEAEGPFEVHLTDSMLARSAVDSEVTAVDAVFLSGTVVVGSTEGQEPEKPEFHAPMGFGGQGPADALPFSWSSRAGRVYRVETSTDLAHWTRWQRVTGQPGETTILHPVPEEGVLFLRVIEE